MIIKKKVLEEILHKLRSGNGLVVIQEYDDDGNKRSYSLEEDVIDSEEKLKYCTPKILIDVDKYESKSIDGAKIFIVIEKIGSNLVASVGE